MKTIFIFISLLVLLLDSGCATKHYDGNNFLLFLSKEIAGLGGKSNIPIVDLQLSGNWTIRRDKLGAAINTEGINFTSLTNALTTAYGSPKFYTSANAYHDVTYIYPPSSAGIAIFISRVNEYKSQITLTKPAEQWR